MKKIKIITCLLVAIYFPFSLIAQEVDNQMQYRTSLETSFKLAKGLKLEISPELRFDENYATDKFLLESGISYKLHKYLSLHAAYRFTANQRETKSTEYLHRFAYSASTSNKYGRFTPSLRLQYTNYTDDNDSNSSYLRYKSSVKYDIEKCKITPFVGVEAFQDISDSNWQKVRYTTGANYKVAKNNYIQLSYKLDYYLQEPTNKHIVSIGYKFKF